MIGNPEAMLTELDTTAYAYDYDPYGVPTLTHYSGGEAHPINPYQFKGGIHDRTTDWVKHGHRWYSVGTGRFTQRDTLDAPLDPANANRYTFAANDLINLADPLGLATLNADIGVCVIICATMFPGIDHQGDLGIDFAFGLGPRIGPELGVSTSPIGEYTSGKKDLGGQLTGAFGVGRISGGSGSGGPTFSVGLGVRSLGLSGELTLGGGF